MDLLVPPSLILHIALDDVLVGVLANGVHVEATRPEMASPEKSLDCRMILENVFGCEALDGLRDAAGREYGNALEQKVHMILVSANLDKTNFVALLDLLANVFQSTLDRFGKGFFPVFHGTDQVVEKQRLIVMLGDVFAHPTMLHLREPTPHSECGVSRNDKAHGGGAHPPWKFAAQVLSDFRTK